MKMTQKQLALKLLQWHDGQNSALYAVGSCMLSDAEKKKSYFTLDHNHEEIIHHACLELYQVGKSPKSFSEEDVKETRLLAIELEEYI